MNRQAAKYSLSEAALEPTRHGALKKVLLKHEDVNSQLMFLNEVYVEPGEDVKNHAHQDMEEIFYFLEGTGTFQFKGDEIQTVAPGDRFIIPAQIEHYLKNTGSTPCASFVLG
ncbi:hypothetical protein KDW_31320 [Dictyobacter vulcani]|uniref:Cupin type-2 domain-containing protein n=1 Tax=Dictyobacter vulcani TaxID=2607529 RepID=A0A5J4KRA3_9CHLR|nr:cupin domain-containing protein [Dictyobacter vulcani]GER88970.1 hypothetical protein KDW_31320 [Dictyobacter vulcani]